MTEELDKDDFRSKKILCRGMLTIVQFLCCRVGMRKNRVHML